MVRSIEAVRVSLCSTALYLTATKATTARTAAKTTATTKAAKAAAATEAVYSPSALISYMQSPFAAWMDRLWKEQPSDPRCSLRCSTVGEAFATRGRNAEDLLLNWLKNEQQLKVVDLDQNLKDAQSEASKYGSDWRAAAAASTAEALLGDADVLYQAPLFHPILRLFGIADIIIRRPVVGGSPGEFEYSIWDVKLAVHPRPYFLAQLGAYAETLDLQLKELGKGSRVTTIGLVLGEHAAADGIVKELPADEVRPPFCSIWSKFREFHKHFDAEGAFPDPVCCSKQDWGRWAPFAEKILKDRDDLMQVAGMTRTVRKKLMAEGFQDMSSFASLPQSEIESYAAATKIKAESLRRLRLQSYLQCRTRSSTSGRPASRLLPGARQALASLPAPDDGDVFFDLEGMSLPPPKSAREYLLGAVTRDGAYHDWWAHTHEEELCIFSDFLAWIRERRKLFPQLHVYHYAAYEIAALKRFASETSNLRAKNEVAELLKQNVFVDLYSFVKGALVVGLTGYGLKQIEKFYMAKRKTAVEKAADSVVAYQQWLDEPDGADWKCSSKLQEIRAYNKDDCDSTLKLLNWLRRRCVNVLQSPSGDISKTSTKIDADGQMDDDGGRDDEDAPLEQLISLPDKHTITEEMQQALRKLKKLAQDDSPIMTMSL
eukprot:TRINITY_DN3206_c0_g9_i1.p1 TRINITY_DN3206_c0_g9~~TRINITY_DN3206_c0_g9_i1.p1  ORF type:complete len:658 (+),score=144.44 TRINITY_DN3206_c0_g9_i1:137-2110(+)